jgi:aminoglycoside 6'-N-acetyltransferase I
MHIVDLDASQTQRIRDVAELLVNGFREHWPDAWPTLADALHEVHASFAPERISRVALADDDAALGWIGGIPEYDGNVWELHPIVVAEAARGRGVGRALVADLESLTRDRGGLTLWVGTDDEDDQTSLSAVDLYDHLPERIATVRNLRGHPFAFYQRLGFTIVGVVPDANGRGKPDILMAKRL